jgi:sugar transferase (PEP-CTERM/EpsH1 system associated)
VAYFRSRALERRIQELWKQRKFDVIWVHCAFAAQYAMSLPGSCQRILDFGDIDSAKWEDYSHVRAGPLSVCYKLESQKLRKFETAAAKKFDKITVTAPGEKETFLGMGTGKSCMVIPNGVDGKYFSSKLTLRTKPRILFLGRMDYFPNIQGIQYFVREVLGLVRKELPGAELQIVGANPSAAVRGLAREPGVTVTGFVKDVRPYLEEAGVAIAPLLIARGTQNKILECMAAGVPVVATSLAAKGVQCLPGTHLKTGDTAEEFARAVLDLLTNPQSSLEMAKVAHDQVEHVHSWLLSMKILDEVLEL